MINRKTTADASAVYPEAKACTIPEHEPASLTKLPFEVLADVFGHAMTGNAAAALRQASDLAVSHPTLSAVLAQPGPEQRIYQRLLAQRRMVQAVCDGVPEYLRPQTLFPLIDVLPKAERRALFDTSLTWLRQPTHVRDALQFGTDFHRAMACIGSLLADVDKLSGPDLKALLHAAAAKQKQSDLAEMRDGSWVRMLSPQAREQVMRYAEGDDDIAMYLLSHDSKVFSDSEFDRLLTPQLVGGDHDQQDLLAHLVGFSPFAEKLIAERFCAVVRSYGKVGGYEDAEGIAVIKFLSHGGPLSDEQEQLLCDKLNDLFHATVLPDEVFYHLSASAAKMSRSVAVKLVPMCFGLLAHPGRLPNAVEAILALWPGVDATQRAQVGQIVDSHLEVLSAHRPSILPTDRLSAEEGCELRDALITKIQAGQLSRAALLGERERASLGAKLSAYVGADSAQWRRLGFIKYRALADQEPGLVESTVARLIDVSNAPSESLKQEQEIDLNRFIAHVSPALLGQIYKLVMAHSDSSTFRFSLMGLCERADVLGDDKLKELAQKIVSWEPGSHGGLSSSAIDLLAEQSRLSTPLRVELTLWCVKALRVSHEGDYLKLVRVIARDNQV